MTAWTASRGDTFALWRAFGKLTRRSLELLEKPQAGRWSCFRRAAVAKVRRERRAVVAELDLRYEGLLNQLWSVAGPGTPVSLEGRIAGETRIWQGLQDKSRAPVAPECLPSLFWEACLEQLGERVLPLKLRFMLRPFVDSIPPRGGDLLRALAYSPRAAEIPRDRETLRALEQTCPDFHQSLLDHLEELEIWTAGVVRAGDVIAQQAPYTEYLAWLFNSPEPFQGAPP